MGSGGRGRRQLILLGAAPGAVAAAAVAAGLDPRTMVAAAALEAVEALGVDPSALGPLLAPDTVPGATIAARVLADALGREPSVGAAGAVDPAVPPATRLAHRLGALHETLVPVPDRRRRGVHYTPPPVARAVVGLALGAADPALVGDPATLVVDPACGGGAFLLATADALADEGGDPAAVLARLVGVDLDRLAVDVTTAALALWAAGRTRSAGDAPRPGGVAQDEGPDVVEGDALALDAWAAGPLAVVVGNPPFGGQLDRRTARDAAANRAAAARLGAAAGYADTAALFLARALDEVAPGGAVALLQPVSVLATRDAAAVRGRTEPALVAVWFPGGRVFAAGVDVCAPLLRNGGVRPSAVPVVVEPVAGAAGRPAAPVSPRLVDEPSCPQGAARADDWAGDRSAVVDDDDSTASVPRARLAAHGTWAPLWAAATGVPPVDLEDRGRLGDRCRSTAGFRDEFYALAAVVHDDPDPRPHERPEPGTVRVLTSGLVEPLAPAWGSRPARLAGRRLAAPIARLADVAASPERRLRAALPARTAPKVVVATQSRVVEVVVDAEGWWWPSVPLVAVTAGADPSVGRTQPRGEDAEATDGDASVDVDELWLVAGALMAPPVTAWALQRAGGTALSAGAVKLSARQVLDVPLPVDADAWSEGSAALRSVQPGDLDGLVAAGRVLTAAHGLVGTDAERVVDWWAARLPGRHVDGRGR